MKAVFADTFYWIALTLPKDKFHQKARQFDCNIMTTDEVLTEYLTFFSQAPTYLRQQVASIVQSILDDVSVVVLPQSHESFLAGLLLYASRPDKGYSLTDCISMQTMWREGLVEILSNDRHFEQEGFRALFEVNKSYH